MDTGKRVPYVEIPAFQGPLDLLLQLIQQEKVDIWDIPIARIADQFLAVVQRMESLDMEVTSEFLLLAAQLLYLKSRMLLPRPSKPDEGHAEGDPRQELVARLEAYRAFKEAAAELSAREAVSGQRYFRDVDIEALLAGFPAQDPLAGVTFADIWEAFWRVLNRVEEGAEVEHVQPEEIPLEVMARSILRRLLMHTQGLKFRQVLRQGTRLETVVAFLAILELLKEGKIRAEQSNQHGDIYIFPTARAWEFAEEE